MALPVAMKTVFKYFTARVKTTKVQLINEIMNEMNICTSQSLVRRRDTQDFHVQNKQVELLSPSGKRVWQ